MQKKTSRPLRLHRDTLHQLGEPRLQDLAGGTSGPPNQMCLSLPATCFEPECR